MGVAVRLVVGCGLDRAGGVVAMWLRVGWARVRRARGLGQLACSWCRVSLVFSPGSGACSCCARLLSYLTLSSSTFPPLICSAGARARSFGARCLAYFTFSTLPRLSSRQVYMLAHAELASSLTLLSSPHLAYPLGRCTCSLMLSSRALLLSYFTLVTSPRLCSRQVHMLAHAELARSLTFLHYSLHLTSLTLSAGAHARSC